MAELDDRTILEKLYKLKVVHLKECATAAGLYQYGSFTTAFAWRYSIL